MLHLALAAALILTAAPALAQDAGSSVVVTFETGARTGSVMVALYDSEACVRGRPRPSPAWPFRPQAPWSPASKTCPPATTP